MAHLELLRDLCGIDVLALEGESRVASRDPQRRDLGEIGDDVLGDAVAEIFLLRVPAHVGKRQDADRELRFLLR